MLTTSSGQFVGGLAEWCIRSCAGGCRACQLRALHRARPGSGCLLELTAPTPACPLPP
jgi:hypothetical protein